MAVTNIIALALATLVLSLACFPQAKSGTQEEQVFRAPFKLKLHVDDGRYYEQSFDRIPYVADNDVYLFAGEAFGLNVTVIENEVSHIAYERSPAKADVELRFTQEKSQNGWMMMLVIRNKLKRRLYLDAQMTLPGKEAIFKTNVLPVEPNLSDFESWPHPIVQLILRNFRYSEKPKQSATDEKAENRARPWTRGRPRRALLRHLRGIAVSHCQMIPPSWVPIGRKTQPTIHRARVATTAIRAW